MHSYHNTTQTTQMELMLYEQKARTQDQEVLRLINQGGRWTAEDLRPYLNCPITSVRRALSNLGKQGKVKRVDEVKGEYNRPIGIYVASDSNTDDRLLRHSLVRSEQ